MKNKNLLILLCLVSLSSLFITGCGKKSKLKLNKTTAVAVKGSKITADEYYNELKKNSIEKLISMIDHKLFDKKYKSDEKEQKEIDKQIESIKSYYKNDDESYRAALKSAFGVEDESELRKIYSLEYKRKLAVNDYIENKLNDKEIKKYYDENVYSDIKASHILISVKTTDKMSDSEKEKIKNKAYEKAKKVIKELDNGKDFKKLAAKYSDDTQTANKGGDLGYFNSDDMDGGFFNGAKALEKGKYSKEPVESSYGYHIILKTGEKKKKSLKSMKKTIKEKIAKDKLNNDPTLYYKSLEEIRKEKKITFGDSSLEKQYNDYMEELINNSNQSNNSTN